MGYRLEAGESVPKGLRRIVREEIEGARDYLSGKEKGGPDEAVHEARKSIKKIRAVLRLIRHEIGPVYKKENTALKVVADDLSEIRDAAAIIESFDELPRAKHFASVRAALMERKKQTEDLKDRDAVISEAALALRRLGKRVSAWPLKTTGFSAIAPGLEETYRRGRKAMKIARQEQSPACFHEWRKRVKDHWYHVRLMESVWTEEMQAREKSLKELETWLGDDHNLSVLRDLISAEPGAFGDSAAVEPLLDTLDKRQKELRENSLSLGSRLYQEKAKAFTRGIGRLWKDWQRRPKRLQEQEEKTGEQAAKRKPAASQGHSARHRSQVA